MKTGRRHHVSVSAAALAVLVTVSACSSDEPTTSETSSSSSSESSSGGPVEPVPMDSTTAEPDSPSGEEGQDGEDDPEEPSEDTSPPQIKTGGADASDYTKAAKAFITARENKLSYRHKKATGWVDEAKPWMTKSFYTSERKKINPEGSLGAEWATAHEEGLAVKVKVEDCGVNSAGGVDSADKKIVQCSVTDILVDKNGKQVPSTQIPQGWTRLGVQDPAVLYMVKQGGSWKVDEDVTGRAS